MKKLLLAILFSLPCVIISQTINQSKSAPVISKIEPDSLSIAHSQVKNVYTGLMQNEINKRKLSDCISIATELNTLIQKQNDSLQKSLLKITGLNQDLSDAYSDREKKSLEIQKLQNRKIPWYKHPITFVIIGFAGGVYLMK